MSGNLLYLFAAFAVVWLLLFGYLLYIANRIGALQQQVDALLEEKGTTDQKAESSRQ